MKAYSYSQREKIRLGISACLLGQAVRFDAGHKRDDFLTDTLGNSFEYVPVCPEKEVGMGVPREAVQLTGLPAAPQMVGNKTGKDWTARMNTYSALRTGIVEKKNLFGFILKRGSPTCGMERVRVYNKKTGIPSREGRGLFAAALMKRFPLLPVEEEGRLNNPELRENFIVRVFSYYRLHQALFKNFSMKKLVAFHTQSKFLILAHSPQALKKMGQFVANAKRYPPARVCEEYCRLYLEALACKTTVKKNVDVLHHILGFLKKQLAREEKSDILETIENYHRGFVPLVVPLTLLKHYVNKFGIEYVQNQIYLNPHPKELMLRNHV